jgi:hypothetical protein
MSADRVRSHASATSRAVVILRAMSLDDVAAGLPAVVDAFRMNSHLVRRLGLDDHVSGIRPSPLNPNDPGLRFKWPARKSCLLRRRGTATRVGHSPRMRSEGHLQVVRGGRRRSRYAAVRVKPVAHPSSPAHIATVQAPVTSIRTTARQAVAITVGPRCSATNVASCERLSSYGSAPGGTRILRRPKRTRPQQRSRRLKCWIYRRAGLQLLGMRRPQLPRGR